MLQSLQTFVSDALEAMPQVSALRQEKLATLIQYVGQRISRGQEVQLTFICTHNSRRSHFAQVWAHVAADYFELSNVKMYSGGTEVTECNPRTIESLRRAGFQIDKTTDGPNPLYAALHSETESSLELFSKLYNAPGNPQQDFAAVICCTDAERKCPTVAGADERVGVYFDDPKISDDTPQEAATYDERNLEIASEMFFLMHAAKNFA